MSAYADISFLVSLYAPDSNSTKAAAWMSQADLPVFITAFGELELSNALHLRIFRKELTPVQVKAATAAFREDLENGVFALCPMEPGVYLRAMHLSVHRTARLGTRTLDILHVASALGLQADVFLTFDRAQRRLARAEHLAVP